MSYRDEMETLRARITRAEDACALARERRAAVERELNLGPLAEGWFSRAMFRLGAAVRASLHRRRRAGGDSIDSLRARLLRVERRTEECMIETERAEREVEARRGHSR
jgi:hypothetical protein